MKRKFLLLLGCFSLSVILKAQIDAANITFESGAASIYSNSGFFGDNGYGQTYGIVANPSKSGINTSDSVLMVRTAPGMAEWAGTWYSLIDTFVIGVNGGIDSVVKCKVYKSAVSNFFLKWEGYDAAGEQFKTSDDFAKPNTKTNEWEEMTFTYTGHKGVTVKTMTIIPDYVSSMDNRTSEVLTYVDDVTFTKLSETGVPSGRVVMKNFISPSIVNNNSNYIRIMGISGIKNIRIMDIQGRLIMTTRDPIILVTNFVDGVYLVKVDCNDNTMYVSKFIKK